MRDVFISLSYLLREYNRIPRDVLETSLFFFGSKRMWIFPENKVQRDEAARQPTDYTKIPAEIRALIAAKEERGEVCFLKPDVLGEPDVQVFGDYQRAAAWLAQQRDPDTGEHYNRLQLDASWWEQHFKGGTFCSKLQWKGVVSNFTKGTHSYRETMELIVQSNANLRPVLMYNN
jgi:hypothetical protein